MTRTGKKRKTVGTIVVIALLAMVLLCVIATPAVAKTYGWFDGHQVARYEQSDLDPSFRLFIDHIDYDLMSAPRMGARLYFTEQGKDVIALYRNGVAGPMAYSVMAVPEWSGDRSHPVKWEIWQHAIWRGRMVVDIYKALDHHHL